MANELNFSFWCGERSVSIAHFDLVWAEWNLVNDRTVFLIQMLVSRNYIDLQTREGHRCIWMLRPWFSCTSSPQSSDCQFFKTQTCQKLPVAAQTLKDTPVTWRSFGCTVSVSSVSRVSRGTSSWCAKWISGATRDQEAHPLKTMVGIP